MKSSKLILWAAGLALMAGGVAVLLWFKNHQHLGEPGLVHTKTPDSLVVKMELPAKVGEFDSTNRPTDKVVLGYLPKDTSYAQRYYFAPDGFWVNANVILMGADRTSIHKPNYCLPGQGWRIDQQAVERLPIRQGASKYELPVSKWVLHSSFQAAEGSRQDIAGLYVFWFVTKGDQTPIHFNFMRNLAWHLISTGELQRWAYVSYFAVCAPGQEDATFERVKRLVATSVPEFQLPPPSAVSKAMAGR
jgi:hypothetical protein